MTFQCGVPAASKAEFDLSVEVKLDSRDSQCVLHYNPDLFEAGTAQRMLDHYQTILETVADNPVDRISLLPLLPEAERYRILV